MTEKRGGNDGEGQDRGMGWVKGAWREWRRAVAELER